MKRNMIIAALAVGVTGVATYLLKRKRTSGNDEYPLQENRKTHHLTQVFSKAKDHAVNH